MHLQVCNREAPLLSSLRRHTEALRIYVHRLRQLPLAEAYCDRVYARRQQQLKEARHAELAAALRRQRSQRDTAAVGMAGGNGYTLAQPMMAVTGGMAGGSGSDSGGTARSLPFGSTAGGAGVPATKLQPVPGSSSAEDGADIYLLLVQASGSEAARLAVVCVRPGRPLRAASLAGFSSIWS